LPHNTSSEWREIYQEKLEVTLQAVPQMALGLDGYLNGVVFKILGHPASTPASPPACMGVWEKENVAHASVNEQNASGIEPIDIQSRDEADTDVGDPCETVERDSEGLDPVQPPVGADYSSGDQGGEGDEDDDGGSESADSDTLPLSDMPTRVRRPTRIPGGVSFTLEDHEAMVKFVDELNRKPCKADWETFWSMVRDQSWVSMAGTDMQVKSSSFPAFQTGNQVRTADAWRRQYSKKRKWIHAEVRRLRSQGKSN
jgi:hypothetical protein